MYVGNNHLACLHCRALSKLCRVRPRLLARNEFVDFSPVNVTHTIFDAEVDEYLSSMIKFLVTVDGIEDELLGEADENPSEASDASDTVLASSVHLKHELSALKRPDVPPRKVGSILVRSTTQRIPEESIA